MGVEKLMTTEFVKTYLLPAEVPNYLPTLLKEDVPQEMVLFPSWVKRSRQLLHDYQVHFTTVVDYPLGNGTLAKKAFEVGKAFEAQGDTVLVWLTPRIFKTSDLSLRVQTFELLQTLSFGRGSLSFVIDLSFLKESEKLDLTDWLKEQPYRDFTLTWQPGTFAANDLAIFRFALGEECQLSIFWQERQPISLESVELYQVAKVYQPYDSQS